jgi:hypothetical protein
MLSPQLREKMRHGSDVSSATDRNAANIPKFMVLSEHSNATHDDGHIDRADKSGFAFIPCHLNPDF